jgi:hypothetical protein
LWQWRANVLLLELIALVVVLHRRRRNSGSTEHASGRADR